MVRRLRIAVSVFFAVVAVALCVLWVRSYWYRDMLSRTSSNDMYTGLSSNWGYLCLTRIDGTSTPEVRPHGWRHQATIANERPATFEWIESPELLQVNVPNWFLVSLAAALSIFPWVGKRFSLRTMLIATTLAAVVLGLGVWAVR